MRTREFGVAESTSWARRCCHCRGDSGHGHWWLPPIVQAGVKTSKSDARSTWGSRSARVGGWLAESEVSVDRRLVVVMVKVMS